MAIFWRNRCRAASLLTITAWALLVYCPPALAAPAFYQLGFLFGGGYSAAHAISSDGSTVVGESGWAAASDPMTAISWKPSTGFSALGYLPGAIPGSQARGVSADGSVIVGLVDAGNPSIGSNFQPYIWTGLTGMVSLGFSGSANAVSDDGKVVAGYVHAGSFLKPSRWTANDGITELATSGEAFDISGDGNVIVGSTANPFGAFAQAFKWTLANGLEFLGDLSGFESSRARAASKDGSVIVGALARVSGGVLGPDEAFRYVDGTGMTGLGRLPGASYSEALAVSGDGSIVVGASGNRPFVWDEQHGMRDLIAVLTLGLGLDLQDLNFVNAIALSADGTVVAGNTVTSRDKPDASAWVAFLDTPLSEIEIPPPPPPSNDIPEPGTLALLALGLAGLGYLRRKQ